MGVRMNKKQNRVIIIWFLIMIFGITAANLMKPEREFSERENRVLEQKPDLAVRYFFSGAYSVDYEQYITDQFIQRDNWIGVRTVLERVQLRQEIKDIYFAGDGYLIEKHTGTFGTDTAERNISCLADFMKEYLPIYGEEHITAMVVPNAVKVLEEKLPPYASPYDEGIYLRQIEEALPNGTWVDTLEVLKEHSDEELYYRTDHHFKTLAAYYIYDEWGKMAGLKPLDLADFEVKTVSDEFLGTLESKVGGRFSGDSIQVFIPKEEYRYTLKYSNSEAVKHNLYEMSALETKDKYGIFFGGNHPFVEASIENGSMRKLLVIKDSYAHCFLPFAFLDFSEVDFVDLRYYNESLRGLMEKKEYTDVLFLYNAAGFAKDVNLGKLRN